MPVVSQTELVQTDRAQSLRVMRSQSDHKAINANVSFTAPLTYG
jgi:hypothetical protein